MIKRLEFRGKVLVDAEKLGLENHPKVRGYLNDDEMLELEVFAYLIDEQITIIDIDTSLLPMEEVSKSELEDEVLDYLNDNQEEFIDYNTDDDYDPNLNHRE